METVSVNSIVILVSVVLGLYAALLAAILGILSALWLRMGSVQQEFGELKAGVAAVREQVDDVRGEVVAVEGRTERRHRELQEQMERRFHELQEQIERRFHTMQEQIERRHHELQEQMERRHRELQEQMERNHNQLMRAILAHSHRPDGRPTFDLPPDFEPTPTDN